MHSDDNAAMTQRRGEYGYDATYALVAFAALGAASAVAAIALLWSQRSGHLVRIMGFYRVRCSRPGRLG